MFVPDGVNGGCWCGYGGENGALGDGVGRGAWWDLVGFGGGIVVWGAVSFVGVLFDFCLIIYIYFMACIGEFVGGISGFRVVSIALFTWCFVVVCG